MTRPVWLGLLLSAAACGGVGSSGRSHQAGGLAEGVVANVDGAPIGLNEVQRLAERGSLSPQQALSRLEAEALLAAEAERRGYGADHAVQHVTRQAAVQALLKGDVEQKIPSEAEISRAYAESGTRFATPERRVASHVLAVLPRKATPEQAETARVFMSAVVDKLRAADDPVAALDAYRSGQSQPFQVRVEDLPPAPLEGAFVKEFSVAMFSLAKPGVVPQPVQTPFGWHAIVLREILPESRVPEAEARAQLQRELELSGRRNRLDALTRQLQARTRISYAERTREALGTLEL
jgi:peptidyl-prolyl cis-trans isomerase C